MRFLLSLLAASCASAAPELVRLHPLGGRVGTTVEIEILGKQLEGATGVEFDCADLVWKHTTSRAADRITGLIAIAPGAALGGHMLRVMTPAGPSTSLLFNAGQFPAMVEGENRAIPSLPAEVYGRLDGAADSDRYWFTAKAGERWMFDLRAMEHGSAVEARMFLFDSRGERVAKNDDRDQFDENPLLEHTFAADGTYAINLDQYRGPRGFTFGKNNAYVLRISQLPRVRSVAPLGARIGSHVRFTVEGSHLGRVNQAYLTEARRADYARMTYPYTMPIRFRPDPARGEEVARIEAGSVSASGDRAELDFAIPASAAAGLWRLWLAGPDGVAEGPNLAIGNAPEFAEDASERAAPFTINGVLLKPRERDTFRIAGHAGVPLRISTLSAQLGGPFLDTVLTLRDGSGAKLAEADDVVAGWGGLLGNPDSTLFYTPAKDGPLFVEVRDRLNRGGAAFPYRLEVDHGKPSFQLFTTPENFTVKRGSEGTVKVHLAREAGFAGAIDIRFEGLPDDTGPVVGRFRADQLFEPNADGADMIIPEIEFRVRTSAAAGVYPIRILGKGEDGSAAEAQTATMIGPIYHGDWNFYRRPVPSITLTVVE